MYACFGNLLNTALVKHQKKTFPPPNPKISVLNKQSLFASEGSKTTLAETSHHCWETLQRNI